MTQASTEKSSTRSWLGIYLRGLAMGAADVVPGVSGGTVAFITGIYEELIDSIKSITPASLVLLIKQGPKAFWQHINGTFLFMLLLGVATSVLSLARLISFLLSNHPLLVWSFFFGLIVASSLHMIKQIVQWRSATVIMLIIGIVLAYGITEIRPADISPSIWTFFGAGCIAICAMILPGISGSFILLLLGMYQHILHAVKDFHWLLLFAFLAGCGIGLTSFSHLLSWLFKRFHDLTLALLTGFLVGSLNLIWPWKVALTHFTNSDGEQVPLDQKNTLPATYEHITGASSETLFCLLLMLLGFLAVLALEKIGKKTA